MYCQCCIECHSSLHGVSTDLSTLEERPSCDWIRRSCELRGLYQSIILNRIHKETHGAVFIGNTTR